MSNTKKMAEFFKPLRDSLVERSAARNLATFKQRIDAADSLPKLAQLETSLDRLYTAGVFTTAEFKRLDGKILDKTVGLSQ